jgi:hypothetical protein
MAVTITRDLTDLWNSEVDTGWTGLETTLYAGWQREGSNCEGIAVSNTTVTGYRTFSSFDMSDKAVYIWMYCAGNMDTIANGGLGIVLGDGTNRRAYYVGGSDYLSFQVGIWSCFMVDATNPPTGYNQELGSAAPNFAAITQVGVHCKTLSKALGGADNFFIDMARYGYGITIGGGGVATEGTFAEAAADDESTASGKAYGIIRTMATGVYGVQGRIQIGNSGTSSSYFDDEDSVVVFENNGAGSSLYSLGVVANSTGTNSIVMGNKVGSGDTAIGANGVTIMSAGPNTSVDLDDTNADTVNIYGSKFFKIAGGLTLSTDTAHEFIGNTIDQTGIVTANQCIIRGCTFSGTTDASSDGSSLLWNSTINIKNSSFNSNTDATNDPHGIKHTATGTFTYDGLTFSGNDYDIDNNSGDAITINAVNDADPQTYENTTGTSTTINNPKTVTTSVEDSGGTAIENAQVFIKKAGDYYSYTSHNTNNTAGLGTFEVNEVVDTDLPQTGWLHVWDADTNTKQNYQYQSWTGKIFTLRTEVTGSATSTDGSDPEIKLISTSTNFLTLEASGDIAEGDAIRNTSDTGAWAIVDEIVDADNITTTPLQGGTTNEWQNTNGFSFHRLAIDYVNTDLVDIPLFNGQTDASGDTSTTYNGTTPASITVRIRSNQGATKYIPYNTSGTITSDGYNLTAVLTEDEVAT